MSHRPVYAFVVMAVSSALFSAPAIGQTRPSSRFSQLSALASCANELEESSERHIARLSLVSSLRSVNECDAPEPERWRSRHEPPTRQADRGQPSGLGDAELPLLGPAGFDIAAARQQVLQILAEHSSCSAWYGQAEENPQRKFASLHYRIDEDGEDTAVAEYKSFGLAYREPYVARAQQNVGAGSVITLNAHGAFFLLRAPLKVHVNDGAPLFDRPSVYLRVAHYPGGSINAQVAVLLHEFAHVVGIVPVDFGEANSGSLSTQNTFTVLQHCRKQVEASSKRVVVLPVSFAELDRRHKSD